MPYFFVDSYQDGKPAPALYVRAENADAALARAAQLGVEGTGVRQAQDLSGDGLPQKVGVEEPISLLMDEKFMER